MMIGTWNQRAAVHFMAGARQEIVSDYILPKTHVQAPASLGCTLQLMFLEPSKIIPQSREQEFK